MPIAVAEQNRAVLAIANAGDDYLALCSADPGAAGANQIAAAGRAEINLGREAGDAAGEAKNLAVRRLRADRAGRECHPLRHHDGRRRRRRARVGPPGRRPGSGRHRLASDGGRHPAGCRLGAVVVRIPSGV